jgi:hypothetical protein
MRVVPDDEYPEFIRRLREQARRDAEELVPQPGFPVFGLAAPALTPALVSETMKTDGDWTLITLAYGQPDDGPAAPYVTVTTLAVPAGPDESMFAVGMPAGQHDSGVEGELRFAVARELDRGAQWADDADDGGSWAGGSRAGDVSAEPVVAGQETLADGEALVVRQGDVWAARLLPGEAQVAVTVVGRGVSPESVRLEQVPSLRPLIEARNSEITRRIEQSRGQAGTPLPVPELPPAEGVAALRALADFTLATTMEIRASTWAGRRPRRGREWGGMHRALWQRAVAERQRLAGEDKHTADDVVTSAVNHLGNLASNAAWFTADERLREAAIDETLRHAMLDERVPSERAQYLWARYWAERMAGFGRDPGPREVVAWAEARERSERDLWAAWEAWAANA